MSLVGSICPGGVSVHGVGVSVGETPPVRLRAGGMHSCILVYMVSYFPFNPCTSPVPVPVQCECTTSAVCEPRADVLICDMLSLKCGHIALFFYYPGGGGGGWWNAWQERRPLQQTVRILLESILVLHNYGRRWGPTNGILLLCECSWSSYYTHRWW